ncbi:MAG TPA: DUF4250 domain-containing protein [Candidatus Anaerobiospirillum pullistercoris]|uniref:DUF4250 domain-containing protein n=1 Tax=Candidatus Anaerobiospirillum pullistercoris TaxID=2838452 RepID=A0A9D1WCL7_9GAMM|nr:DUF4250 domain-containing protein [Candidatus Anaerobiospirillum pullistercoris]
MDPFILLSAVNLKLRDEQPSLDELCRTYEIDEKKLCSRLKGVGFTYNAEQNQFR